MRIPHLLRRRSLFLAVGVVPLALLAASTQASSPCQSVRGSYVEHAVGGAGCTAPTGLCIAATYRGSIRGTLFGQATTISPNVDTAATGVLMFTSDSSFDGSFRNRTGTLTIKNAGAFRTVGGNSIVDLQSIVGGTGDFAGATGEIRASGIFANGAGASDYVGQLCLA